MYNKLRKRFILLSLAIAAGILVILIGGINISSISNSIRRADEILLKDAKILDSFVDEAQGPSFPDSSFIPSDDKYPYKDDAFFSVEKKEDNSYQCNLKFINSIEETTAISFFEKAMSRNANKGFISQYRYLKANNKIYFLDFTKTEEALNRTLIFSLIFSVGGIAIFFGCLYLGSALVFKNVKENDKRQNEFITDASHQLKTPLMVIAANNDVLELKNGESEETKIIAKEIDHLNSLVSNMLTLSRSNERLTSSFTNVSLSNLINESIEMFQPLLESNNIALTSNIQENITVFGDEYSINESLKIIIENAIKYARTNIKITLQKSKRSIEFIEENDSDFAVDKDLNYLTERFFRDKSNSENKSGSGIGLSLLKTLIDRQKASLDIHAKDSQFILRIKFKITK